MGIMTEKEITCTMCGYKYKPSGLHSCQSCPINHDCSLICCPNCGFQSVDIEKTKFTKFISSLWGTKIRENKKNEERL
jgi:hypothetical protein